MRVKSQCRLKKAGRSGTSRLETHRGLGGSTDIRNVSITVVHLAVTIVAAKSSESSEAKQADPSPISISPVVPGAVGLIRSLVIIPGCSGIRAAAGATLREAKSQS